MEPKLHGEIRLDWFQGTLPVDLVDDLVDLLTRYCGEMEFVPLSRPVMYRYTAVWRFKKAVRDGGIFLNPDVSQGVCEAVVQIKGEMLGELTGDEQFELCYDLFRLNAAGQAVDYRAIRPTHFDLAYDDFEKVLTAEKIFSRYARKGKFGPFKKCVDNGSIDETYGYGKTMNFGRRGQDGGGLQVGIYNKTVQSKGKIDAVRYEARFYDKNEKSVHAWEALMSGCYSAEEWSRRAGELIGGSICFYESVEEKNVDRRPVAAFWQKIRERLGAVRVRVSRNVVDSLVDAEKFIRRSCAPALSALFDAKKNLEGEDAAWAYLRKLVEDGRRQRSEKWDKLIPLPPLPGETLPDDPFGELFGGDDACIDPL